MGVVSDIKRANEAKTLKEAGCTEESIKQLNQLRVLLKQSKGNDYKMQDDIDSQYYNLITILVQAPPKGIMTESIQKALMSLNSYKKVFNILQEHAKIITDKQPSTSTHFNDSFKPDEN